MNQPGQWVDSTYTESITLKSEVTLEGAGADVTIIDGQGARHVVVGANNATLDGFTITGGNAAANRQRW